MINHHPSAELLLDYASGSAAEAVSLIVACHVSQCGNCREAVRLLDAIGGALFQELEPEPVDDGLLDTVMARLDESEVIVSQPGAAGIQASNGAVPAPLARYLAKSLQELPWRRIGRLFDEFRLPLASGGANTGLSAKLMRLRSGSVMPVHTHRGQEFTLVLAGGYADQGEQFAPGDFDARDPSDHHQPVVDIDGECLCLVVLDAPIQLTGIFSRMLNPFLKT